MPDKDEKNSIAASLDGLFETWNRADQPGLIVGARHRGKIVYRRAFGMASLETGVANSVATQMRIGSTSKHFLAVLALQLQQEGLLDLDAPIGKYIPELTAPTSEPTVRQLLQHRGGTRCHIDLGLIGHSDLAAPAGSALATLRMQRGRNFLPGEATMYNNGGYHLVSLAASRQAGMPFPALLRRYQFDPLEMNNTALVPSDYVMTPGIASFHLRGDGCWRRGLCLSHEILGEGGIVSTVDDMLKWTRCLHSRDLFGQERTLDLLTDAPPESDGSPGYYGLGMMARTYRGVTVFNHPGGVLGGSADLACIPDHELDIIIMSNGAPSAVPYFLSEKIVDIVLADRLDPPTAYPDPKDHQEWLGCFGSRKTGMVYGLQALNGTVFLTVAQYRSPYRLERAADNWLSTDISGLSKIRLRCERLEDGTPSIRLRFAGQEDVLERLPAAEQLQHLPGPDDIEGEFESPESGLSAKIERQDGQPTLTVRDRWGVSDFDLLPLGGQWLTMLSRPNADQFWATLWFPDGWAAGFTLNSARTRNLPFKRVSA